MLEFNISNFKLGTYHPKDINNGREYRIYSQNEGNIEIFEGGVLNNHDIRPGQGFVTVLVRMNATRYGIVSDGECELKDSNFERQIRYEDIGLVETLN